MGFGNGNGRVDGHPWTRSPWAHSRFPQPLRGHRHSVTLSHSALNAFTGSRRDARSAGYTPNNTPTPAPRPSASMMDHIVTRAGSGDTAAIIPAKSQPPIP